MAPQLAGHWFRSDSRDGPLFHAALRPAQKNSGKLVTLVKQQARLLAQDEGFDVVLVDGPPGIGCPVISAASGAHLALIVAEPAAASIHDMARVLATTAHFRVQALVCINKADIYPEGTAQIEAYCRERDIEVVGHIPFDASVTAAMVQGQPVTAFSPNAPASQALAGLWQLSKQAADTIRTVDPAAEMLLAQAEAEGIPTVLSRAAAMAPCLIGKVGECCKNCHMGPCRLVKPGQRGVCGATLETVAARNLARAIAAGAAAHSDHGLDMALTLEAVARGEAPGYEVRDPGKLRSVAEVMGIRADGRPVSDLALAVAERALGNFSQMRGELTYVSRAPARRQQIWRSAGISPRSVTREIVETLHRTHIGADQDPEHILRHALRTALSDGWGGSMLATDISDILFVRPSIANVDASGANRRKAQIGGSTCASAR